MSWPAAWREAAIADGWQHEPLYAPHETEEQACRMARDGFKAHVIVRGNHGDSVAVWGPDGMQVRVPREYTWEAVVAGLRTCQPCGATDVDTVRYSFAGRCCAACRPAMARQHEYPGWTR